MSRIELYKCRLRDIYNITIAYLSMFIILSMYLCVCAVAPPPPDILGK